MSRGVYLIDMYVDKEFSQEPEFNHIDTNQIDLHGDLLQPSGGRRSHLPSPTTRSLQFCMPTVASIEDEQLSMWAISPGGSSVGGDFITNTLNSWWSLDGPVIMWITWQQTIQDFLLFRSL
uniref:Uncharacterized protein n=1 Tax=Marmota marmota marmota TaxID=9994 RepID=A0A8C5YJC8_MARMA